MRKYLFVLVLSVVLLPLGLLACETSDPLTEGVYNSDGFYAVDGGHLSREYNDGGGYWHEHNEDGINLSPGNSAATLIAPNISSLGGWRLDALGEWLYFDVAVEEDYDGVSDAQVQIFFEVNADNSGGLVTDTVDFQLEFWCKRLGERTNINVTYNISTVVGQAEQHDLFVATVDCTPTPNSLVSFRLELITITSDVDNVIVNYVKLRYPTYTPALEVS
jgi:hypothetical protein